MKVLFILGNFTKHNKCAFKNKIELNSVEQKWNYAAKNGPGAIICVQCLHVKSLVPSGKAKSQMGIQFWIPFSMKRNFAVLRETKKPLQPRF